MNAQDACRLAAELAEEYGDAAYFMAARAVATFEADGRTERAIVWRTLQAILGDIAKRRLDPRAPISLH